MHPRTEEVIKYLDKQRAALRAAVDAVPEHARNTPPSEKQWSVAQVLNHLTMIDRRVAMGMSKWIADAKARGLAAETGTSSVLNSVPSALITDRSRRFEAPEEIRPGDGVDADTAWSELEEARAQLRAAFLSGDGLALGEIKQAHPVLGPINMYQWMLFVGSHEARHALQIREIGSAASVAKPSVPSA